MTKEEAIRRGLKPFAVEVLTVPSVIDQKVRGAKVERKTLVVWGKTKSQAVKDAGIE